MPQTQDVLVDGLLSVYVGGKGSMLIPGHSKASDSRSRLQSPSSGTAVVGKALDRGTVF